MGAGALPYGASVEDAMEKLQCDLFYIKNMSIALDLFIISRPSRPLSFAGAPSDVERR